MQYLREELEEMKMSVAESAWANDNHVRCIQEVISLKGQTPSCGEKN